MAQWSCRRPSGYYLHAFNENVPSDRASRPQIGLPCRQLLNQVGCYDEFVTVTVGPFHRLFSRRGERKSKEWIQAEH